MDASVSNRLRGAAGQPPRSRAPPALRVTLKLLSSPVSSQDVEQHPLRRYVGNPGLAASELMLITAEKAVHRLGTASDASRNRVWLVRRPASASACTPEHVLAGCSWVISSGVVDVTRGRLEHGELLQGDDIKLCASVHEASAVQRTFASGNRGIASLGTVIDVKLVPQQATQKLVSDLQVLTIYKPMHIAAPGRVLSGGSTGPPSASPSSAAAASADNEDESCGYDSDARNDISMLDLDDAASGYSGSSSRQTTAHRQHLLSLSPEHVVSMCVVEVTFLLRLNLSSEAQDDSSAPQALDAPNAGAWRKLAPIIAAVRHQAAARAVIHAPDGFHGGVLASVVAGSRAGAAPASRSSRDASAYSAASSSGATHPTSSSSSSVVVNAALVGSMSIDPLCKRSLPHEHSAAVTVTHTLLALTECMTMMETAMTSCAWTRSRHR